jgi:formamidopyrimidine-DNA glycosylase
VSLFRRGLLPVPELPEVETVVRGLRRVMPGKIIDSIYINAPKIERDNFPGWLKILRGKKFRNIQRRGKNILINLSGAYTLWVHLKMTGHLYYLPKSAKIGKHDLMVFGIRNDSRTLRFNDYRRFGRVRLCKTDEVLKQKGLVELGPEPLEISRIDFVALIKSRQRMIKPALLDQAFLAGLGNIYADETLYLSRIHPRKSTNRVSSIKLRELYKNTRRVLKKAIRLMGTSVDSYAGVDGKPGGYQKYLLAYGREGLPCKRCGAKIKREKIGSRSAHFCPRCQRL